MDIFTLSETYQPLTMIDEFVSAIWTERYSTAGDVQITLAPTPENIALTAPDTYLGLKGSEDIMTLETQEIEKGLLKVKGRNLITFLNQRYIWPKNPDDSSVGNRIVDYTNEEIKPSKFIEEVVEMFAANPTAFTGAWAPANLDWVQEKIPNFEVDAVFSIPEDPDKPGGAEVDKRCTMPVGPLYDGISQFATKEGVGIRLRADEFLGEMMLWFSVYRGEDRTSGQEVRPLIRLTPELDSINNIKELRSNAMYKNVCYVYYQGIITKHLAEPSLPEPTGMKRRVLITNAEGEPVGRKYTVPRYLYGIMPGQNVDSGSSPINSGYTGYTVGPEEIAAFREQHARDAFANNNYIRSIDGQASPMLGLKYKDDYDLGDIIELQGLTGAISKARVTEFIRTQDATGEKAYPTISVIEED